MTIKSKLIANVAVTAGIVVAISFASFFSMRFLQEKLSYLTEKSTPFQIHTIELQQEMQACITSLVKLNGARSLNEYKSFREESEKNLERVEKKQVSLKTLNGAVPDAAGELRFIAQGLFASTEDRIYSSSAAATANSKISQSMKDLTARLKDLDKAVRNLQMQRSDAFVKALENTGRYSATLKNVEALRNQVKDLQQMAMTLQNARNASALLIAKSKLNTLIGRMGKNEYHKSNTAIAALIKEVTDNLDENLKLLTGVVNRKEDVSSSRIAESEKALFSKLNVLFLRLDQETELASGELELESRKQAAIFSQSNSANTVLVANSELVSLGLMVTGETNRLFAVESPLELDALDTVIRGLFTGIDERVKSEEKALDALTAKDELKMLRSAAASLAAIRSELYSADGIISTLKDKLKAVEQAGIAADKLHALVMKHSTQGRESVTSAQAEQEKAISAVHQMIRRNRSRISGIGLVAISFGMLFGFWIYRSVLLPLRVVQNAVVTQQSRVEEKAALAESVAGGDLSRDVTVSEVIAIDPAHIRKDEMGAVLQAVAGMSEAQATLDRAFADMTGSLRANRDDAARRDRMKSGLFELNKILRSEHEPVELATQSLTFIADFFNAGVGIMYLYDNNDGLLRAVSRFAAPWSKPLEDGFRLGEGLPGQAALARKIICLDTDPPDYLTISSALGEAAPLHVAIAPVMHNDSLIGVIEIGRFIRFGEDDFDFLVQALEGVAIAINVTSEKLNSPIEALGDDTI